MLKQYERIQLTLAKNQDSLRPLEKQALKLASKDTRGQGVICVYSHKPQIFMTSRFRDPAYPYSNVSRSFHSCPLTLALHLLSLDNLDIMSDVPQTRSKRSLSPSATSGSSSAWTPTTTARKTSRPNHHVSSTVRAAIPNLDSQQLREIVQRLVDFHPSARETVADLLPSIKPRQGHAAVKSTESIYFKNQVDWCELFLADKSWARHPSLSPREICDTVRKVLEYETGRIDTAVEEFDLKKVSCTESQLFVDAAVAILDIGLLIFKRQERLAKAGLRREAWSCKCCPDEDCSDNFRECPVLAHLSLLFHVFEGLRPYVFDIEQDGDGGESDDHVEYRDDLRITSPESNYESLVREWITAVGYATFDGSPHAIRSVILKYNVKLPPMLPYLGPNAEPIDTKAPWLFDALRSVDKILTFHRLPEFKPEVVPDLGVMSI